MKVKTRKKALSTFIMVAMVAFIAWIGVSYIEVCCKNLTTCNYSDWNAITMFIEFCVNR